MKTIFRNIIFFALLAMPVVSFASLRNPSDMGDTIPVVPRCDDYYYTQWIDDCPNWRPNGVWDSCFYFKYRFHNFLDVYAPAKWERAKGRMKVKGLVAMVQHYNPPTVDTDEVVRKLPEYLYLNQLVSRSHFVFQDFEDHIEIELLDSVRWDTATARVMEFRQGWNDEFVQYCYLYEAYFKQPVWVDTDFYIYGSTNCNYPGSGSNNIIPTVYIDIMDFLRIMKRMVLE